MAPGPFFIDVQQRDHFRFDVTFDDDTLEPVILDEPEPLGTGRGPNAARMLAASVGHCLSASLLLCVDKARVPVHDMKAHVEGVMERNEAGRFRIARLDVTIVPTIAGEPTGRFDRCLDIFEDFCIVTQSVRAGIEVDVRVEPEVLAEGDVPAASDSVGEEDAAEGRELVDSGNGLR